MLPHMSCDYLSPVSILNPISISIPDLKGVGIVYFTHTHSIIFFQCFPVSICMVCKGGLSSTMGMVLFGVLWGYYGCFSVNRYVGIGLVIYG